MGVSEYGQRLQDLGFPPVIEKIPQLQQTAVLFAPERQAPLAQLQLRPSSFDTRHPLPANLRATPLR